MPDTSQLVGGRARCQDSNQACDAAQLSPRVTTTLVKAAQALGTGKKLWDRDTLILKAGAVRTGPLKRQQETSWGRLDEKGPEGQRKGLRRTVRSLARATSQLGGSWTSPTAPQSLSFPICQVTLIPASGGDERD